jgi:hypothetical protein
VNLGSFAHLDVQRGANGKKTATEKWHQIAETPKPLDSTDAQPRQSPA